MEATAPVSLEITEATSDDNSYLDELSDEEVVQVAHDAQDEAKEAEAQAGSVARWRTADAYYALSQRGWSTRKIGAACGVSHTTVRIHVRAVERYLSTSERPVFWHAYGEITGERLDPLLSSNSEMWETPQDLFDALNGEFGFTLDVCSTADNAKCKRFFTAEDDGLSRDWTRDVCWMNPPYGDEIAKWMEKAFDAGTHNGTVVCLVPARVDTGWWWDFARHGEVRFLRGRLKFGDGANSAPFPSAVVVFEYGRAPSTVYWSWQNK